MEGMDRLAALAARKSGTSSQVSDLVAYAQAKAERFNSTRGTLEGIDCPLCLNRGYIMFADDKGRTSQRECKCMVYRRVAEKMRSSGLGNALDRYTFDNFQTPDGWYKAAKRKAEEYAVGKGTDWFVACGQVGAGKSHLCTAICNALMRSGREVAYMAWRDDATRLKASVSDSALYGTLIEQYKRCKTLYIDDLFKGNTTSGDINLAFEILNNRYSSGKRTIISTEKTLEQILNIDEAIGSRIYERSKGFYLEFPKKNWRMR